MIRIPAGSPLALAIQRAKQAMEVGDYPSAAIHYREALVQLTATPESEELSRALCIEHVGGLIRREQLQLAAEQAETYIACAREVDDRRAELELLVFLAEARAAQDNWALCKRLLNKVVEGLEQTSGGIAQLGERGPYLLRLRGLLAAEEGDLDQARDFLREAGEAFADAGLQHEQRTITLDLLRLDLWAGDARAVEEVRSLGDIYTTAEVLLVARALRRDARYEKAAQLIEGCLADRVEPTLRFHLLHELVLLYQLLADKTSMQSLLPQLSQAASEAADPAEARATVDRLGRWFEEGFTLSGGTSFEARLHTVRAFDPESSAGASPRDTEPTSY